nr:5-bromo-4-chloroindolyl phosphate hydrolysis family protein [Enterococcus mediterraneensis]
MKKLLLTLLAAVGILFLLFAEMDGFHVMPGILLIGGIILIFFGAKRKKPTKKEELPALSKEKEAHYLKSGMSESEIDFFRETMNQAKSQIQHLQGNINNSAKLKAIDLRHDTLRAAKALFKELVKEPQKLHSASHFLYTHLPNMVDLTDKFIEINSHEIKSKETYDKIEESSQIIDQMAALISQDYQQFVADDLDDIDIELSIAKQSLKRDNG